MRNMAVLPASKAVVASWYGCRLRVEVGQDLGHLVKTAFTSGSSKRCLPASSSRWNGRR